MFSIPRNAKGNYDWNAIADGRYYVEWYVGGTRRRVSAGVTAAQALEVQRRKHHELEGRKLGIPGFETAGETVKKPEKIRLEKDAEEEEEHVVEGGKENNSMLKNQQAAPIQDLGLRRTYEDDVVNEEEDKERMKERDQLPEDNPELVAVSSKN